MTEVNNMYCVFRNENIYHIFAILIKATSVFRDANRLDLK